MVAERPALNPLLMALAINADTRFTASECRFLIAAVSHTDNASLKHRNAVHDTARGCGVSKDTATRAIRKAKDLGYLSRVNSFRTSRGSRTDFWFRPLPPVSRDDEGDEAEPQGSDRVGMETGRAEPQGSDRVSAPESSKSGKTGKAEPQPEPQEKAPSTTSTSDTESRAAKLGPAVVFAKPREVERDDNGEVIEPVGKVKPCGCDEARRCRQCNPVPEMSAKEAERRRRAMAYDYREQGADESGETRPKRQRRQGSVFTGP